jgi:hypothetical protein
MDVQELSGILQSDMALWDRAEKSTNDKGQLVVKTELPHGIGEFVITFEGVTNAIQRRAAAEQWAANIRAAISDIISEESVTARAQQALARTGGDSDQLHALSGFDREFAKEIPDGPTVQTHEEQVDALGQDPASRLAGLRRLCDQYTLNIRSMRREIEALTAYVEVMNADKENEECDTSGVEATCDATP